MLYSLENGKSCPAEFSADALTAEGQRWGVLRLDELEPLEGTLGITAAAVRQAMQGRAMLCASLDGFDLLVLTMRNAHLIPVTNHRLCVYLRRGLLLFLCEDDALLQPALGELLTARHADAGRVLYAFLEMQTEGDVDYLEDIEQEIADLENALLTSKKRNCVKEIISLRKRLMSLKRYYEQMLNILEDLQENNNDALDDGAMRYIKLQADRVDRLFHNVLNLRDYVTQVRESYQAEVDISLNNIMKVFTVITAIFLPLTLIVGWYGMNLKMPEFSWDYGYPMVILLSISVVVLCVVLFRRNKWF